MKDTLRYLSSAVRFLSQLEDCVPCMVVMNDTETVESRWKTRATLLKRVLQSNSFCIKIENEPRNSPANQNGTEDAFLVHRETDSRSRNM